MAYTEAPTNLFKMHFKDDVGRPATMQCHVDGTEDDPAGGGCAIIAAAAQACSNDALASQEIIITATNDAPGSPTDGPYARGADKLLLVLTTSVGTPLFIQVGAPQESVLANGNVYVNPADPNVTAFIAAMVAHGCDADGDGIVALQRGYRRRPPRRKHA
jgi:hypothetical protein